MTLLPFCSFFIKIFYCTTSRALGGAHVPQTNVFRRLTGSVNKTTVKPRVAEAANFEAVGFSRSKIPRTSAYTIAQ